MGQGTTSQSVFLLLDTCGERASAAVARADGVALAESTLGSREASTGLVEAIQSVLAESGLALRELDGIGVVNGPGSFTGVRVGLAMAKGLCEAAQLPLAAVSRLEVLAEAGPVGAIGALQAGREELYVRAVQGAVATERLMRDQDLRELRRGALVVVDSPPLAARLEQDGAVLAVELTALRALRPVLRTFAEGGSRIDLVDANYVRDESAIYRKTGSVAVPVVAK